MTEDKPIIAAFGNPLLDVSVVIHDEKLLEKYNLSPDDQREMTYEELQPLLKDVHAKYKVKYGAGGSAQNTSRVLQWLIGKPGYTMFIGGVGNDEHAKTLTNILKTSGVATRYVIHEQHYTGTCVALINGPYRSLIAYVGASQVFSVEDLEASVETKAKLRSAKLCYIEGFFLTDRHPLITYLQNFCQTYNQTFAFNLSGVYLFEDEAEYITDCALRSDILFGNADEFQALGKFLDIGTEKTNKNIALFLNRVHEIKTVKYPNIQHKIVVITNNSRPVVCVSGEQLLEELEVPNIPIDCIQDTTGAGDSFVAGFLAALLSEKSVRTCVAWGCWTSRQIIRQIGCTVPDYPPHELDNILV